MRRLDVECEKTLTLILIKASHSANLLEDKGAADYRTVQEARFRGRHNSRFR
jgi:hypothetical protein